MTEDKKEFLVNMAPDCKAEIYKVEGLALGGLISLLTDRLFKLATDKTIRGLEFHLTTESLTVVYQKTEVKENG